VGRRRGWGGGQRWENGAGHFVKNVEESKLQTHNMIIYFVENTRASTYLVEIRQIWRNNRFVDNLGFGMILAITLLLYHNLV